MLRSGRSQATWLYLGLCPPFNRIRSVAVVSCALSSSICLNGAGQLHDGAAVCSDPGVSCWSKSLEEQPPERRLETLRQPNTPSRHRRLEQHLSRALRAIPCRRNLNQNCLENRYRNQREQYYHSVTNPKRTPRRQFMAARSNIGSYHWPGG
jgi:hypothetical protein